MSPSETENWVCLKGNANICKLLLGTIPSSSSLETSRRNCLFKNLATFSHWDRRWGYSEPDSVCFTLESMTRKTTSGSCKGTGLASSDLQHRCCFTTIDSIVLLAKSWFFFTCNRLIKRCLLYPWSRWIDPWYHTVHPQIHVRLSDRPKLFPSHYRIINVGFTTLLGILRHYIFNCFILTHFFKSEMELHTMKTWISKPWWV